MRYRVVNVQQIELLGTGNGGHFCRESEVVGLMFEQGVAHHFHFVKVDSFAKLSQPRRQYG